MAKIKNGCCDCASCRADREYAEIQEVKRIANQEKHLNHPFYKKVDEVTAEIATEQILKGAEKYPEPFNPDSWTNLELVRHQLQELRDAQVYSVGLLDRLEKQEKELEIQSKGLKRWFEIAKGLERELKIARDEAEYWRAIANGS